MNQERERVVLPTSDERRACQISRYMVACAVAKMCVRLSTSFLYPLSRADTCALWRDTLLQNQHTVCRAAVTLLTDWDWLLQ